MTNQFQVTDEEIFVKRNPSFLTTGLSIIVTAISFLSASSLHAQWTESWGDDFNGTANTTYNHNLWTNEVKENTGNVWGDGTIQSTSDSLSNVYLDGSGDLIIAMTYNANPPSGQTNYESARLKSLPTTGLGPYGQFDFVAQNPSAVGMGAAIWSMGASNNTGTPWPWCGELDMMEIQAVTANHNGSTIHGGQTDGQTYYEYGGLSSAVNLAGSATFDNGFHEFTTNWAPYHLQYYLDGVMYGEIHQYNMGITDQWSTNKPYQLILSSGIGGNGGTPNGQGFPSNLTIQYVHYNTWSAGAPAPVTNLAVTGTSSNSVNLSWTASTSADVVYNVYASTTSGFALDDTTEVIEGVTGTSYTSTGLAPNTTYYYTVVASNWGGESAQSNVTAITQAPGNSTQIQLSAGGYAFGTYQASNFVLGGATNFHWQPGPPAQLTPVDVSDVTNPAPQEVYNIERFGPAAWTITGLTPLAGYNVRLHFVEFTAKDAVKGGRDFNVAINSQVVLPDFDIWSAAGGALNKAVVEEFYTEADENGIIEIANTMGTSTTAVDLNPTINALEIIPATGSNPVGAEPGTTTDLAINSGGPAEGNFVADEDFVAGDTSTTTASVTTSGVANAAPEAVYQSERYVPFTYVLNGLEADATYTVNMHFAETYWTAAGKRIFNINLNGTRVLANFDVYALAGADKALVEQFTTNADKYGQIIVQLFDGSEDNPFIDGIEAIETASACNTVPAVPTGLTATATSDTAIGLTWSGVSAPTGCSGVTYNVYGGTTANPTTQIASGLTSTSYSNTGLSPSTTYYYTVKAVDTDGSSAASTQASTETPAASCAADTAAPTGLTVTSATSSAIGLSWTAPTPPANCTVSSYTVYGGTSANPTTQVGAATGTTTTVSGLTASTTYYFTVAAVDGFGTSTASAQVTDTTSSGVTGADFIAIAAGGPAESDATGGDANFAADVDFSGGGDSTHTTHTINLAQPGVNAAPMGVYQYGRAGVTTYTIPGMVAGSTHTVLLHFSENYFTAAGKRVFNVAINGITVLSDFDIYKTVGAQYTALEETFTATANSSGDIVIAFTDGTANQPLIDGIEIR
jgi:fibronectin type 3 domain-containing protein